MREFGMPELNIESDLCKPKRYTLDRSGADHQIEESLLGEFVLWEDFAKLLSELRAEQSRYDELRMQHRNCDPRGLVFEPRVITRVMDDGVKTKDGAA